MPQHKTVHKLKAAHQFQLMGLVKNQYSIHAVTDLEFARYAEATLGFKVTNFNVAGARDAFGIPSTREAVRQAKPNQLAERFQKAEDAITALQQAVIALQQSVAALQQPRNIR